MPGDRDGYVDAAASLFKLIGSPAYPPDEDELRALIGASYDRSYYPDGFLRQLAGDPRPRATAARRSPASARRPW